MKDKLLVLWWIPLWVTFGLLMLIGPANPGSSSERDIDLPRTTERPVRKRGDECSDPPVRVAPQSHGRKSVVRGLLVPDTVHEFYCSRLKVPGSAHVHLVRFKGSPGGDKIVGLNGRVGGILVVGIGIQVLSLT